MPARPAKFARCRLDRWISGLPRSFEIRRVERYIVNVFFFFSLELKDLETSNRNVNLNSTLHIGPSHISLIINTALTCDCPSGAIKML